LAYTQVLEACAARLAGSSPARAIQSTTPYEVRMRSLLFCTALFLCAPLAAGEKRGMTPEDLWRIKRVSAPSVAPDGKWAAVDVTEYDLDSGEPKTQIWLLSTDGKQQKQLTTAAARSSGPKWSP